MYSWRINFWDLNFLGTWPLEWHYALIHTRKKEPKKKLLCNIQVIPCPYALTISPLILHFSTYPKFAYNSQLLHYLQTFPTCASNLSQPNAILLTINNYSFLKRNNRTNTSTCHGVPGFFSPPISALFISGNNWQLLSYLPMRKCPTMT